MKIPGHLLSRADARAYLGISEYSFEVFVRSGQIKVIPLGVTGRTKAFTKKILDDFLEAAPQVWHSSEAA